MARWLVLDEAARTWRTFRADWLRLPRERRTRFAVTLTVGWLVAGALVLGMALGLRRVQSAGLEAAERAWLERLVAAAPFGHETAVFLESPGNGVVLLPLSIAAAVAFARRRRPLWALGVLAACLMAAVVVGVGWVVWERPRPDFLYGGLPESGLSAFPSGHAAMSISTYGFLAYLWLRRTASRAEQCVGVLLLLAVVTVNVLARLVLSAHWPSDVAGGALLGLGWLAVVILALRQGEEPPADA